jgi:hypothetical protein
MSRTALIAAASCAAALGADPSPGSFLVTNDDLAHPFENTATFYAVNADGTLGGKTSVTTGGGGIGGGFFAAARAIALPNGADACVYVSNAWDGDIAAIAAKTRTLTGTFFGYSPRIPGPPTALAWRPTPSTCTRPLQRLHDYWDVPGARRDVRLSFVSDVFAAGLNGGVVDGMAIHGDIMVITYGDGSIESFDISGGVPVSNGDQQELHGFERRSSAE